MVRREKLSRPLRALDQPAQREAQYQPNGCAARSKPGDAALNGVDDGVVQKIHAHVHRQQLPAAVRLLDGGGRPPPLHIELAAVGQFMRKVLRVNKSS